MKVLVRAIYSIIFLFIPLACTNYDDDIISLKESISAIEIINQEQSNLISSLQEQIDEIKRQQEQDKLAAEAYINSAISSISQLSDIIDGLTSNFINQAANLALLQVDIETIEEQILDLESQINLIDSTGDISEINDLLSDIQDNIDNNSDSINSLISRISNLELDSEKYDSDIIGCYYLGDFTFQILENGIGFYEGFSSFGMEYITFIWEKVSTNEYQFVFPSFSLLYLYDYMDKFIVGGTYLRTINSTTNDIYFPLSGDIDGWVESDGSARFYRGDCPN
jgi:uncharacterized coiled-coil protein SlyX